MTDPRRTNIGTNPAATDSNQPGMGAIFTIPTIDTAGWNQEMDFRAEQVAQFDEPSDEISPDPSDPTAVAKVEVGDIVTIPGTSMQRCRVRMVRSPVPGVIWLYLADALTDWPLRGHVALTLDRTVVRHHAAVVDPDQIPEDG